MQSDLNMISPTILILAILWKTPTPNLDDSNSSTCRVGGTPGNGQGQRVCFSQKGTAHPTQGSRLGLGGHVKCTSGNCITKHATVRHVTCLMSRPFQDPEEEAARVSTS